MKNIVQSKRRPRYYEVPNQALDGRGNSKVRDCEVNVPKELSTREHACPARGKKAERDSMAAHAGV